MVYARTIKRRSGNGINASLRNVTDLMMAAEVPPSQAPPSTGVLEETDTDQTPSDTVVGAVAAVATGEGSSSTATDESSPKPESEAAVGVNSKATAQVETEPVPDSITSPSSDHTSTASAQGLGCSNDSLNNNHEKETTITDFEDEERRQEEDVAGSELKDATKDTMVVKGDSNRLNNNNISNVGRIEDGGLLILGSSVSLPTPSTSGTPASSTITSNRNHLNNILNNNSIQQPVTNSNSTSNTNNINNNWWAPPAVQSQQGDMRNGGTGKLSLLGSGGENGMKFGQGNHHVQASTENGSGAAMLPKAILKCRPNSHPFQTRTLALIPNVEMKVGRAVARHPVSEGNAIFDCKVLSRNHAVLWYCDDKFYIRDTGSSNGTFVNNQRLSQTCLQSDKFEICSGDIVQFGVDVIENARKETHGCIVATIRLYLPDGRETKASQLTGVSAESGQVLAEDLYRMHQYIKEALLREQMLEVKMTEVQRLLESAKGSVNANWQAMVDEDRLLNRIDILEGKVHVFQKNFGEEKLRDEMRQMQDDKLDYQHAAKEALRRVHQDRYEAVQKLSGVELALRMTEDEASVLRDKFFKSESTLNETMTRLSTVQQKHDELHGKCGELEGKLRAMEAEAGETDKNLEVLIEMERAAQQSIRSEEEQVQDEQKRAADEEEEDQQRHETKKEAFGKAEGLMKLFANSDLRNLDGSADIINSICNSAEEEESDYQEEDDCESVIERVVNHRNKGAVEEEDCPEKGDGDQLDTAEATEAVQGISCSKLLYKLRAVEKYLLEMDTGEKKQRHEVVEWNGAEDEEDQALRSASSSTTSTLRGRGTARTEDGVVMTEDMQQLVGQLSEICGEVGETIRGRSSGGQGEKELADNNRIQELLDKVAQLERENECLSSDLHDRPTISRLEAQVKLADDLQLEMLAGQLKVAELREKLEESLRNYEGLSEELRVMRGRHDELQQRSSSKFEEGDGDGEDRKEVAVERKTSKRQQKIEEERERELDEKMLTNPMVEVEEELVLYKEKFVTLSEENIKLQSEMEEARRKYEDVMQRSMVKLMMYMGPVVAILGYFVLWPYL